MSAGRLTIVLAASNWTSGKRRTLRRFIKAGVASALHWTGADAAIGAISGVRQLPVVFGYHRVVDDFAAHRARSIPPMLVSRRMFERHLDWIGRRFRFASLDEIGARLASGRGFRTPVAGVTFDDGYRDVYEHAFPLLVRKGIPATIFVVTDWVGQQRPLPHDWLYLLLCQTWPRAREVIAGRAVSVSERRTARALSDPFSALRLMLTTRTHARVAAVIAALEAETTIDDGARNGLQPLTWEMLLEMRRAGLTIGSHTKTHTVLTRESRTRALEETVGSRRALEERLGAPIDHFAYPDGAFNAEAVDAVAAAGYHFAYTTCRHQPGRHPLLTIPRRPLWESTCLDAAGRFSPAIASCLTNGVFDLVVGCGKRHGAPAAMAA